MKPPLQEFHEMSCGAVEAFIVTPPDIRLALDAAATGDPRAAAIMQALNDWLTWSATARPGDAPLCLSCDVEFTGGAVPTVFAMAVPFANPVAALVSGVCYDCAARARRGDGLMASALRGWRAVWPDLRAVEGGRA